MTMQVTKRDGRRENLSFDKILKRIKTLCDSPMFDRVLAIDPAFITQKVITTIYNGVTSSELDEEAARFTAGLSENMDSQELATRIIISNLHKNTIGNFKKTFMSIEENNPGCMNAEIINILEVHGDVIEQMIDYSRDYMFTYFGFKTLEKSYLYKINNKVVERPQHLYMRVALAIHKDDLENVSKTYSMISRHLYTHASPTMFNAGSKLSNLSSCYLLGTEDSIEGIFNTYTNCAKISKLGGGIGVHISNVRAKGSVIKGTNGHSDGIIPMLKVYNEVSRYVNQCFTEDTRVYTSKGPKKIKDVCRGDKVITIDGTFKQVNEQIQTEIDKEILEIKIKDSMESIKVTKEHRMYVRRSNGDVGFIDAGDIHKGDYMYFPKMALMESSISNDEAKLLGIVLAYGSGSGACVTLSNVTQMDLQDFVKKYLETAGIKYKMYMDGHRTSIRWVADFKEIQQRYMEEMNVENIVHFLKGIFGSSEFFSTTSENLVYQIRFLMYKAGILSTGEYNKNTSVYTLTAVRGNEEWSRVETVEKIHYKGIVYDLNVQDNHNYLTDSGLVHNSGRRKGSFAMYIEPWHADILEFLDLRKNQGAEEMRARDLFYSIWTPDYFMRQVEADGNWWLMCPNDSPGLADAFGEDFDALYDKYVSQGRFKRIVKAREIWSKILDAQIETGVPYIGYKDAVNKKCNQKNLGVIKSSNLCSEISLYSDDKEYAVCNLCSIALPKFVTDGVFDFDELHRVASYTVVSMNKVIDNNYYPTSETKLSDDKNRPLGIGVQGLADVYCKLKLPFESKEAAQLNKDIFETLYHGVISSSIALAKRDGAYKSFDKSPFSQGKLQFDLANEFDDAGWKSDRYDWAAIRADMIQYGIRNSMLTALMPTASSAQIMGNSESFEVINSCMFKRRVLSGEFVVLNRYLVNDLDKLGLWNATMRDLIILHDGSIQDIQGIPDDIKRVYKTSWEISMKSVIEQCRDRGMFIDQMQSMNLYMSNPNYKKLTSMHFYAWKNHLKTGMYYLRSKSASMSAKFSIDANLEKKINDARLACSIENKDECMMCTS